jgi:hypothetical protein
MLGAVRRVHVVLATGLTNNPAARAPSPRAQAVTQLLLATYVVRLM